MASVLEKYGFKFVNFKEGEEVAQQLHFSHAVIVPPSAQTVLVSGQVGIRQDGSVPKSLEAEYEEAFLHVERALQAAGLGENALEYVFEVSTASMVISLQLSLAHY